MMAFGAPSPQNDYLEMGSQPSVDSLARGWFAKDSETDVENCPLPPSKHLVKADIYFTNINSLCLRLP